MNDFSIRKYTYNDKNEVIQLWDECGLTVPWNDPEKDIFRKTFFIGRI